VKKSISTKTAAVILIISIFTVISGYAQTKQISGKIIDATTKKPLPFVSVIISGTNIGTVTNTQGEFKINFNDSLKHRNLQLRYIGYKNKNIPIDDIKENYLKIKLNPSSVKIDEIVVRPDNPKELFRKVLNKIPENYTEKPNKEIGFYREYIKKRKKYVSISEAAVEIYKAPYNKPYAYDMVKLYKGHKSANVKSQDTVILKLKGGPKTALLLDIAKNPDILFGDLDQYDFSVNNVININDKLNYVIEFKQKPGSDIALYNGKIYVNVKNLAVTGAKFSLNLENKTEASRVFVRKKSPGITVTPEKTDYIVSYIENNGKYYFYHARGEISFKVKRKRKPFKSVYTVMTEIAITDRTDKNVKKIPRNEQLKGNIIFEEKVYPFADPDFWGSYNIIKPEESIEKAIKKYGVKLQIKDNAE